MKTPYDALLKRWLPHRVARPLSEAKPGERHMLLMGDGGFQVADLAAGGEWMECAGMGNSNVVIDGQKLAILVTKEEAEAA